MRDQQSCQFERYYPISELNYNHLKKKLFSVYDDNIFPFFREFNVFSIENFKIISDFGPNTVSKAGKIDSGDKITRPVKFACKPELTLTRLLG